MIFWTMLSQIIVIFIHQLLDCFEVILNPQSNLANSVAVTFRQKSIIMRNSHRSDVVCGQQTDGILR
jgi:hypothetical protein